MGFVYIVKSTETNKVYIGWTKQTLAERFWEHCRGAEIGYWSHLAKAIRLYGKNTFSIEPLFEHDDPKVLMAKEIELIAEHDSFRNGYNMTKGGEGTLGWSPTEETRKKMSEAKLGKPRTTEARAKQSAATKGKPKSEETKRRMSEGMTRYREEQRQKRAQASLKTENDYADPKVDSNALGPL